MAHSKRHSWAALAILHDQDGPIWCAIEQAEQSLTTLPFSKQSIHHRSEHAHEKQDCRQPRRHPCRYDANLIDCVPLVGPRYRHNS